MSKMTYTINNTVKPYLYGLGYFNSKLMIIIVNVLCIRIVNLLLHITSARPLRSVWPVLSTYYMYPFIQHTSENSSWSTKYTNNSSKG